MAKKRKFRGQRMSLGEFHEYAQAEQDGHRRWRSDGEFGDILRRVPTSTFQIPRTLFHITHYSALPSIRRSGLDPGWRNAKTGLNAQSGGDAPKYMKRDAYLTAVYLGTSGAVGTSMQGDDAASAGGKVELAIKVPRWFMLRYMRYANAVISSDSGTFDNGATGSTVLCFGIISPEHIYVVDPRMSRRHIPLKQLDTLDPRREYDFRVFAEQPSSGEPPLLSNQALIERAERLKNMVMQSQSLPPPITDTASSSRRDESPPTFTFTIPQSFLGRLPQSTDEESQSTSDDEWDA